MVGFQEFIPKWSVYLIFTFYHMQKFVLEDGNHGSAIKKKNGENFRNMPYLSHQKGKGFKCSISSYKITEMSSHEKCKGSISYYKLFLVSISVPLLHHFQKEHLVDGFTPEVTQATEVTGNHSFPTHTCGREQNVRRATGATWIQRFVRIFELSRAKL